MEGDIEVTFEDQQMINAFSKINSRVHSLTAELKAKKDEATNIEEAQGDVLLLEAPTVRYRLGEAYIDLPKEEAEARLEKSLNTINADVSKLEADITAARKTLSDLKARLYAKFKNNINLEE